MSETANITVNENPKAYTFRRLNSTDIFAMSKLVSKIGLRDFAKCFEGSEISSLLEKAEGDSSDTLLKTVGVTAVLNVADVIFENLSKCENEIYTLLSRISDLTVDEIKALDMSVFMDMVVDFVKKEEFKDFISAVSKLIK